MPSLIFIPPVRLWLSKGLVPLLLALSVQPLAAQRTEPRQPQVRLAPRPDTITVERHPAGIMVRWTAVPQAKAYFLGRAAGGEGWRRVNASLSRPSSNSYLDSDIYQGVRYRYQVAAIDSADRTSLRVSSDTITAGSTREPRYPGNVTARATGAGQIAVSWSPVAAATSYRVMREIGGRQTMLNSGSSTSFLDRVDSTAEEQRVFYVVSAMDEWGRWGPQARSNPVTIPKAGSTTEPDTSRTDSPDTGAPPSAGPASVLVAVAPGATVRVGATTKGTAGSGAHWLSLDPGIARVSPNGVISGRSVGTARIVAVSRGAAGVVNVSVVAVTVSP